MRSPHLIRAIIGLLLLPLVSGNRPPPKWQAIRSKSVASTERCVAGALGPIGRVRIERGDVPEAGKVRFFLVGQSGHKELGRAVIYVDGERGFSSVMMNATNDKLGNSVWRALKRRCRLHDLGGPN